MSPATGTVRWPAALIVLLYGFFFLLQQSAPRPEARYLNEPLAAELQQSALGYFHQLGAEILYVKAAVFLGGRSERTPPEAYAPTLARYFQAMTALHPFFQDIYYLSESSLAWISPPLTRQTNALLTTGIQARPDLWAFPFFKGFNYFYYLDEPGRAAVPLRLASTVAGAPSWVGHLATVLAARGGNIYAGYIWLKAMLNQEENESTRSRYRAEIAIFEKALLVEKAIRSYHEQYGQSPKHLGDLEPEFIARLPKFEGDYVLSYKAPKLFLQRKKRP